jgi:hypothetical protein
MDPFNQIAQDRPAQDKPVEDKSAWDAPACDAPARDTLAEAHHREELSISVKSFQKNADRTLEVMDYITQARQLQLRRKQKAQEEESEQAKVPLKEIAARQMAMAARQTQIADRREKMAAQREEAEKEA